jgi:hypothetical protein
VGPRIDGRRWTPKKILNKRVSVRGGEAKTRRAGGNERRRRGAVGGKQRALSNPNLVRGRQCDSAVARASPSRAERP